MNPAALRTDRPRGGARLLLFLLLAGCGGEAPAPARPGPEHPNVLLLVMDTARADRFGFDGGGRATSPRLDAFAREGVVFLDAWAPAGWTGPSHASLFTGLRPVHHGYLLGNRNYLDESATTLAEVLGGQGYRTACLTGNPWVGPQFGLTQGFEIYEQGKHVPGQGAPSSGWAHARAVEIALAAGNEGRPFFVFVNDMEPHLPSNPPERFAAPFLPKDADAARVAELRRFNLPLTVQVNWGGLRLSAADWAILSGLYDGEIAWLDDQVGQLLDGLREQGLLDDTIVVITADHGEHIGERGLCDHKQSLYRPICRVPLLVRYPGAFEGGRQVRDVVRLEDLMPTLLEMCRAPVPEGLDGASLLRDLRGRISRAAHGLPPDSMLDTVRGFLDEEQIDSMRYSLRSAFDGRFHLVRRNDGREELYEPATDPLEATDLSATHPAEVTRLRALLDP